jgi:serine/threonine protein kinase
MSIANWIGKTIGNRYQIEEILGSGGMSTVFKATDPNLKRVVAVKMIHPHMSMDEDFVRRFEEEATGVAQLRHPNIVQVHDYNHDQGTYYMVLEFVPGETLGERLVRLEKNGRWMSNEEVVNYGRQICGAVDYAHQRGLIHRDLKPANVMLNVYGDAILMDFGIAKIIGGTRHTATGAVIGTAMYMSPEQIKGMEIDRRTDIYSLGVMMFEMVSGRPPFQADSAMTLMMMHVNDPVPDLRHLRPDLSQGLVAVIEKALEKNRNLRFQTAAEMAKALESALQGRVLAELKEPISPKTVIDQGGGATERVDAEIEKVTDSGTKILDNRSPGAVPQEGQGHLQGNWDIPKQAVSPGYTQSQSAQKRKISPAILAGGAAGLLILVCLVIGGFVFLPRLLEGNGESTPTVAVAEAIPLATLAGEVEPVTAREEGVGAEVQNTATPESTLESTVTLEPTATLDPTATPEPTITPSPTFPTNYYVEITGIQADSTYYIVDYETYGFTEQLPGTHIHFFFDTVPVEQAGVPGSGPWILYGGPRPFSQYRLSEKPGAATMMCARVANPDHSLYDLASGNCYPLP